jgi:cytochrome c oxidase subunit 2
MPFTADKTGDFVGHCSVFCGSGHGGMSLTLHVVN